MWVEMKVYGDETGYWVSYGKSFLRLPFRSPSLTFAFFFFSLIRELLKSTHHAHTRADSSSAPLSENFKLASFSPSLLSAMRFSHSGASAHTQDFADAWHDIDLEILGIVDDHLKNLDHLATVRLVSPDQSMPEGLGISHGRDNQSASSQHRDAWTEGELVCQFLERAKRWITTTG
jgi:hypothetical protein